MLNIIEHFSYTAVFFLLAFAGFLVPIPEEIIIITVGYVVAAGFGNMYVALIDCILGIFIGDNLLFWLSKSHNPLIKKLKKRIKQKAVQKFKINLKKHIGKTIFLARFIVGLRIFGPVLAGSLHVKSRTFQFYNTLAILIYVPIFLFLGYHFHNQLGYVIAGVEAVRHVLFSIVLIAFGYLLAFIARKRYIEKNPKKA